LKRQTSSPIGLVALFAGLHVLLMRAALLALLVVLRPLLIAGPILFSPLIVVTATLLAAAFISVWH
jgi:hypothetical protein